MINIVSNQLTFRLVFTVWTFCTMDFKENYILWHFRPWSQGSLTGSLRTTRLSLMFEFLGFRVCNMFKYLFWIHVVLSLVVINQLHVLSDQGWARILKHLLYARYHQRHSKIWPSSKLLQQTTQAMKFRLISLTVQFIYCSAWWSALYLCFRILEHRCIEDFPDR